MSRTLSWAMLRCDLCQWKLFVTVKGGSSPPTSKYGAVLGDRLPLVLNARRGAGATVVVGVSENSWKEADALCAKLQAAGGACIVLRNLRG